MWRPLGVDTDEQIAEYDALVEGVPDWMQAPLWEWVRVAVCTFKRYEHTEGGYWVIRSSALASQLGQALRLEMPRMLGVEPARQAKEVMQVLAQHPQTLQIVDYLLAHCPQADRDGLDNVLRRSNSAWRVGERAGLPGLVRRVPEGVQVAADEVMGGAGRAGLRLARAWELLYGPNPNPSEAYRHAILAIEDASIKVVLPKDKDATLGRVIGQMASTKNWDLPMLREPATVPTKDVVLGMMRTVWEGQHDRHGGNDEPERPGNVSQEEATVAVLLAVTLVGWFDAALVARR